MRYLCGYLFLLASLSSQAAGVDIQPLIQPGYVPRDDAKMDERGIWMQMQEAEIDLRRSPLVLEDTSLTQYVRDLGCEVAGEYCADLRLYVIRNPTFNASMTPNGTMLIHTGLLTRAVSTDQIAAVLGHELAHYTQKHSLRRLRAAKSRMTVGMLFSLGFAVGGVNSGGLPELFALSSVMSFNRKQESEADVIGTRFMNEAGYDPMAASGIWMMLEQEEENASIKRPKGSFFLSSHPAPKRRAQRLANVASSLEVAARTSTRDSDLFLAVLHENYELLLDEQVNQRDFGRLSIILDRHEKLGMDPSNVAFYRGEARRLRGGAGDHERAIGQYRTAIAKPHPNPRAYRELGFLLYKHNEQSEAKQHFATFLQLQPDASDREMIEFYLEGSW